MHKINHLNYNVLICDVFLATQIVHVAMLFKFISYITVRDPARCGSHMRRSVYMFAILLMVRIEFFIAELHL